MSDTLADQAWRATIEARLDRLEAVLDVPRDRAAEARAAAAASERPAPTSDERRDAILARIAEALPRPDDGTGLHDGGSTGP